MHIVINARVDSFIRHVGDERHQLDEAIWRGHLYLGAGADCIYPFALGDRERIAQLTDAIPGPVNVLARRGGLSIGELGTLGVRRISFASGLFLLASDQLRTAVRRLAEARTPTPFGRVCRRDLNDDSPGWVRARSLLSA
jgi:2-methylisocitrate lyase-like PEP mutase family enzyme